MSQNKESKSISTIIPIPSDDIQLKSGNLKAKNAIETKESSVDQPDQGCSSCSPKVENKESLSLNSSSDEYTEQSLSLNKKSNSIAYKGMMDIALLTANANQLRFLISYNSEEKTFYISATMIALSLVIQLAVGIAMIFRRRLKQKGLLLRADKLGSFIICGIFCLAVLNILVVSFTTTAPTATKP